MGFFSKLKEGLTKTRDNIVSGIVFSQDFRQLMTISMMSLKKPLLWVI